VGLSDVESVTNSAKFETKTGTKVKTIENCMRDFHMVKACPTGPTSTV